MGTLKVPGHVPGILDEPPHQDFPNFPGHMVHDVTTFCRKLLGLREAETFAPNTQPVREEKRSYIHLPQVCLLSHSQVPTYLGSFVYPICLRRRGSMKALES